MSASRDVVWRAKRRLMAFADMYRSPVPLGVRPSHGAYGSVHDWDVFTSVCDARIALVLAMGRVPNPCTGHVLPERAE